MKVNYHTHSRFCDGKGDPRDYVEEAIKRGFNSLGFSSHAPIKEINDWTMVDSDIPEYILNIKNMIKEYANVINIHLGLEVDYYPDENRFDLFKKFELEYFIGSVHMVKPHGYDRYFSVDESLKTFETTLNNVFDSSIRLFVTEYYKCLRALIKQGGFNILGHFDLVKKFNSHNRFFSESEQWYIDQVMETLELLTGKNLIVEVNTGALSRGLEITPYPSEWILRELHKRDIKICLNSDAHAPNGLDCYFNEALDIISRCGYTKLHTPFEIIEIRSLV